jgi:hypothetical protein
MNKLVPLKMSKSTSNLTNKDAVKSESKNVSTLKANYSNFGMN